MNMKLTGSGAIGESVVIGTLSDALFQYSTSHSLISAAPPPDFKGEKQLIATSSLCQSSNNPPSSFLPAYLSASPPSVVAEGRLYGCTKGTVITVYISGDLTNLLEALVLHALCPSLCISSCLFVVDLCLVLENIRLSDTPSDPTFPSPDPTPYLIPGRRFTTRLDSTLITRSARYHLTDSGWPWFKAISCRA